MKNLEVSAKTVEEAIQRALEQLGVSREEVEVTVVKEGKHGILGLGTEEATVRVRPLMSKSRIDIAETARDVLETLLTRMEVVASILPQESPSAGEGDEADAPITFDIKGDDLGILIGRGGRTLSCLQYMVRLIVAHQTKTWLPIIIDVEGYKQRRYEILQALAWRVAEQVKAKEAPFTLKPMPAYERRIIHLSLADHSDVTTESIGEGEARRVVILPKEK
jgi:spoIIIJ-associated protein